MVDFTWLSWEGEATGNSADKMQKYYLAGAVIEVMGM